MPIDAVISFLCLTYYAPTAMTFFLFLKHMFTLQKGLYICCLHCVQCFTTTLSSSRFQLKYNIFPVHLTGIIAVILYPIFQF